MLIFGQVIFVPDFIIILLILPKLRGGGGGGGGGGGQDTFSAITDCDWSWARLLESGLTRNSELNSLTQS